MIINQIKKYLMLFFACVSFFYLFNVNASDYPNTSVAIIDLNKLLNVSKVAISADEQIEKIASEIDEKLAKNEKELMEEQQKLIEAQSIMAPEAFDEKRVEYEKKVQDFQINSQNTLIKLENKIAIVRSQILDEIEPILEEVSKEKGITVILEKGNVILNAENMDITELVLKKLDKNISKIKVEFDE